MPGSTGPLGVYNKNGKCWCWNTAFGHGLQRLPFSTRQPMSSDSASIRPAERAQENARNLETRPQRALPHLEGQQGLYVSVYLDRRHRDRQRDRQRGREGGREAGRARESETERQTETQTERESD